MSGTIPPELMGRLSEFVSARLGLRFPQDRWSDLARGMRSACHEFGRGPGAADRGDRADPEDASVAACIEWLTSAPLTRDQLETLASHLTVGETYFMREKRSFQILEERILPDLFAARRDHGRRLRLWSAACCTGEEAYSLAITVTNSLPDLQDWDVTILATDINPRYLHKASEGVFTEWSFREAPPGFKERYFSPAGRGRYRIRADVRQLVTFASLNLAEDAYPSILNNTNGMDVIFCRNVLIYYGQEQAARVVYHLRRCLADDGWLFVAAAETPHGSFAGLTPVFFPGILVHQKRGDLAEASQLLAAPGSAGAAVSAPPPAPAAASAPLRRAPSKPPRKADAPTPAPAPAPDEHLARAAALYEQGSYGEAVRLLTQLVESQRPGPSAAAAALLARVCANQGDLDGAARWSAAAIAADKMDPRGHYLRATILQEKGEAAEAAIALRRALYLEPGFVMAHFALGHLARRVGKAQEAVRHFRNAARLLRECDEGEVVPESEGIPAGRLAQMLKKLTTEPEALP